MATDTRALRETLAMAEMARLAGVRQECDGVVEVVLAALGHATEAPLVCLSWREEGTVRHHARLFGDADPAWAEETGRRTATLHEDRIDDLRHAVQAGGLDGHTAWYITCGVHTRTGRAYRVSTGWQTAVPRMVEEELGFARLVHLAALVIDHALLVEQIETMHTADSLTGVANERRLGEVLEYELTRARFRGADLSLLMIDVEGLDGINRSYGHQYGNHVLRKLAALLGENARPVDLVARCGPDDFVMVLPDTDAEAATEIAEDLRARLAGVAFAGGGIGVSAAVAHVKPGETLNAESLLRRAELALAEAKRQDREWSTLPAAGRGTAR